MMRFMIVGTLLLTMLFVGCSKRKYDDLLTIYEQRIQAQNAVDVDLFRKVTSKRLIDGLASLASEEAPGPVDLAASLKNINETMAKCHIEMPNPACFPEKTAFAFKGMRFLAASQPVGVREGRKRWNTILIKFVMEEGIWKIDRQVSASHESENPFDNLGKYMNLPADLAPLPVDSPFWSEAKTAKDAVGDVTKPGSSSAHDLTEIKYRADTDNLYFAMTFKDPFKTVVVGKDNLMKTTGAPDIFLDIDNNVATGATSTDRNVVGYECVLVGNNGATGKAPYIVPHFTVCSNASDSQSTATVTEQVTTDDGTRLTLRIPIVMSAESGHVVVEGQTIYLRVPREELGIRANMIDVTVTDNTFDKTPTRFAMNVPHVHTDGPGN